MRPVRDIYYYNKGSLPNVRADLRAALGELIGMATFIFLALSGVQVSLNAPIPSMDEGELTLMQVQTIAISFGMGIAVALFISAHISGGVLNPAVLLSLLMTGNINWLRGIFYFLAEMIGGILGAYFASFIAPSTFLGQNALNPKYNSAQGVFAEALFTCSLCLTILFVIVDKRLLSDFAPIIVGIVVFLCHTLCTTIDGTSINPARSFAAAVVTGKWDKQWIFWVGPCLGGFFAVIIYLGAKILTEDRQLENMIHTPPDQTKSSAKPVKDNSNHSMSIEIH